MRYDFYAIAGFIAICVGLDQFLYYGHYTRTILGYLGY
jgi:hypothetical protein